MQLPLADHKSPVQSFIYESLLAQQRSFGRLRAICEFELKEMAFYIFQNKILEVSVKKNDKLNQCFCWIQALFFPP